jgi:hypothetical protein
VRCPSNPRRWRIFRISLLPFRAPRFHSGSQLFGASSKTRELKTGRHGATAERPIAECLCRLPSVSRHDGLRAFAGAEIAAEPHSLAASIFTHDFKFECSAGIPMPNLNGVDAMPMRALAASQQKIDRGRRRAARFNLPPIAERFAEMPTLGMRL